MACARELAIFILATFVGFGCSGVPESKGTIEIGSDLPTSGSDALFGLPTQYGAAFAVARAGSVRGFPLKFVPYDDTINGVHDPRTGVQNVQLMITNRKVLGFVGPFTLVEAMAEIPVANQARLAMISPTNHEECLTLAFNYCQAAGATLRPTGKSNYFRIAAADTYQGPAMADFAYDTLGLRTVAVWDDQQTFGMVAADGFATEFTKKGGTIVSRQGFDIASNPNFHAWLRHAKAGGAQAIYAGTAAPFACIPRQESQGIFPVDSYYLGPDYITARAHGIANQQCIIAAGAMANDHLYGSLGVGDASLNPSAAATIAAYKKAHPDPADTNTFTFAGYDCAAILIDAIGRAIDANGGTMPTRQQVIDQLAKTTNFQGLTGTYTFDTSGDPTTATMQIMQYRGGAWTPIKNVTVAGS
jgi:branched-chain amino acid transport system substrate-binding protein